MTTKLSNEELVEKAAITTDALASQGKLNPAQSDRFIDYVVDESVLKNNARVIRFRNESLEIDKIGIGKRVAMPKAEAKDPGLRRGVTTSKVTLAPSTFMVPFEISDEFRELNIEGDNIEDTIIRLMATQTSNDLEELYVLGNKLGPARLESDMNDGQGSTTLYVRDNYIALQDGWNLLADSGHVVDAGGTNIGVSLFSLALRNLPTKFRRNRANLRWYMSPDLIQIYQEKLATRATAAGDAAITGTSVPGPFGIPMVGVPSLQFLTPTTEHIVLTGTTPTALKSKNVSSVVVVPSTLANVPTAQFSSSTDYVLDAVAGTITRTGGSTIGSGNTVKVTYNSSPRFILTHMNNFIVAIGRDIRIEKDRDIFKGVNQYAITGKVAVQYEEVDAIVTMKNIGTGV